MNSALQPQLLKLEEVFDETVKARTTIQEELKSAILLRCVGGQLKSYLSFTIGDNVEYSTLREHVLQWDRSQQKRATSMVASRLVAVQNIKDLCQWTLIESKMPKEKVRRARTTIRKEKVKMPRAKEGKEKEIRKEQQVIIRVKAKTRKAKVWQRVTLVESQGGSVSDYTYSWSTTCQRQQGSSAETKPRELRTVSQSSLICEKEMMSQEIMEFE